jgi:hypothetical protein
MGWGLHHWFRGLRWVGFGRRPVLAPTSQPATSATRPPSVGDEIYVDTALHIHRGRDDVLGGRARVVAVHHGYHGLKGTLVEVAEHPGDLYNWELLSLKQSELAREFGDNRARPNPDLRPEFNDD